MVSFPQVFERLAHYYQTIHTALTARTKSEMFAKIRLIKVGLLASDEAKITKGYVAYSLNTAMYILNSPHLDTSDLLDTFSYFLTNWSEILTGAKREQKQKLEDLKMVFLDHLLSQPRFMAHCLHVTIRLHELTCIENYW